MKPSDASSPTLPPGAGVSATRGGRGWLAPAGLGLAVALAYAGALRGPFIFDDIAAIRDNATIRDLGALGQVLAPPHDAGNTVGGRPLVNLSLALNQAAGGLAPAGYHVVNILIHLGAALLLYGAVRRTLAGPVLRAKFGAAAGGLALAIAALWALHPLQTEAVTYVVQRAEALGAFFQLLVLYAFIRAITEEAESGKATRGWLVVSVAACWLGATAKETLVTAPVLVLMYDRAFVAGAWGAALRRRWGYYAALAAAWVGIAALVAGTGGRGGTAGFGSGVSAWEYSLTQYGAILRYLGLAAWPHPLIFDYGTGVVHTLGEAILPAVVVWGLVVAAIWALVRRPAAGFAAGAFFLLLAPSSSVVPVASQTIAEHRMYLPLAAVVAMLVIGLHGWLGRRGPWLWAVIAVGLGALTWQRNAVYADEIALWSDTVRHRPGNARAHSNLGNALLEAGRVAEAVPRYEEALRLQPDYVDAENNLGRALAKAGRHAEALPHLETARRAKPDSVEVLTNLSSALAATGRTREAVAVYERIFQLDAGATGARYNFANLLFGAGDMTGAAKAYEDVLRRQPEFNDARFNLAAAQLRLNRVNDAIASYEEILRRTPGDATAHAELANIFAHTGRTAEAIAHYETAVRLKPDLAAAQAELTRLRAGGKR